MSEYLILDGLVVLIPLVYSFEKRVQYYKTWNALFRAIGLTMIPFISWDILFTHFRVWHFNPAYTSSLDIAGLPLAEWLFFIVVPYSCLYIYAWVKYFRRNINDNFSDLDSLGLLVLGVLCLVIALVFHEKSYTLVVFSALGFTLLGLRSERPRFMKNFWIAFLISLIPFFLVNGYLTAQPVVLYDNQENLGIRLTTIPIEDVFYGLLLLLMNTFFYEQSLGRGT